MILSENFIEEGAFFDLIIDTGILHFLILYSINVWLNILLTLSILMLSIMKTILARPFYLISEDVSLVQWVSLEKCLLFK